MDIFKKHPPLSPNFVTHEEMADVMKDISDNFEDNLDQWAATQKQFTLQSLINSSFVVALAGIISVSNKVDVKAIVLKSYKGNLKGSFFMKTYLPWGFGSWFVEGEKCFVFLDEYGCPRGYYGRMPIIEREKKQFVAAFLISPLTFFPDGFLSVVEDKTIAHIPSLIEKQKFISFLENYLK